MKNRKAWGLGAGLAVLLMVGGVVLAAHYQSRLPEHQRSVILLPMGEWGFTCQKRYWVGATPKPTAFVYRCGFFAVCVTYYPPTGPKASAPQARR
jgi:hypothetical protein